METMRESWTDERLDDGFDRVAGEIQLVREEIGSLRHEIGSIRQELRHEIGSVRQELHREIGSVREEIGSLRNGLDGLRNILIYVGGAMVVGMLGVLVAAFCILITLS